MSRIISILKFYDPFRDGELAEAHPVMYVHFFQICSSGELSPSLR